MFYLMVLQNLFFLRESRQFCGAVVNKEKEWHSLRVETGKMGPSSRSAAESV